MINGNYCSWGKNNDEILGLHMAGLKYKLNNIMKEFKCWMVQVPYYDGFSDITNEMAIWGITNYPQLKEVIMSNLKIILEDKLIDFNNINVNSNYYNLLTQLQKDLCKLRSVR